MKEIAILPKVLVIHNDEQIRKQLTWALSDEFSAISARDRLSAIESFRNEVVPLVLLDLQLEPHPPAEALQVLDEVIQLNPLTKVMIFYNDSERHNALDTIYKGAYEIFPKPVNLSELKAVLHSAYRRSRIEEESIKEHQLKQQVPFFDIVGNSPQMQEIFATIHKVATTDIPILITGESGTGKELIANAIHDRSYRKNGPFVSINCGAIPDRLIENDLFGHEKGSFTGATVQRKGKLEYANGGTLLLEQVDDLVPELQIKILRLLQEGAIERFGGNQMISLDIRVIATTDKNLEDEIKEGRFRKELYFGLGVVKIALPPLRERGNDVIQLAEHMAMAFSKELRKPVKKLSKAAIEAIRRYNWPGNVGELQNRVKRALVLTEGPSIGPAELELEAPNGIRPEASTIKEAKEALEKEILENALRENKGNISRTAKALGVSRPTLYDLISRYGL